MIQHSGRRISHERILQRERVIKAAGQKQSVAAGRPFAVIAKKEIGLLLFRDAQTEAWSGTGRIPLLVVVLPHVA